MTSSPYTVDTPPRARDAVVSAAGASSSPIARPALSLALLLLFCAAVPRASAQAPQDSGDDGLSGVVLDAADARPLAGAEVHVVGEGYSAITDSAGRFRLTSLRGDAYRLVVLHRGVRAGPVEVEPPADGVLRLRIRPGVVPVPEIEVTVERRSDDEARLAGFHRRLERRSGYFLTAEQIARRDPSRLSHVFRQLPGLIVERREFGGVVRSKRPDCQMEFFVDGVRSSFLRVDALRPGDVAGIEVYHGTSRVPPQFVRPNYCGAVVVWTRVPGDPEEP